MRPWAQHLHLNKALTRHALSVLLNGRIHLLELRLMKHTPLLILSLYLAALLFGTSRSDALTIPAREDSYTAKRTKIFC
jgi:hypothetical protein